MTGKICRQAQQVIQSHSLLQKVWLQAHNPVYIVPGAVQTNSNAQAKSNKMRRKQWQQLAPLKIFFLQLNTELVIHVLNVSPYLH